MVFANDYYPFGMAMPERSFDSPKYSYGFNGKEKDEDGEWGDLTHYDYGFRIYNPGIARFLSVDPLTQEYPWYTPYQFAGNTPLMAIDIDGNEPLTMIDKTGSLTTPVLEFINAAYGLDREVLRKSKWESIDLLAPFTPVENNQNFSIGADLFGVAYTAIEINGMTAITLGDKVIYSTDSKKGSDAFWLPLIAHEEHHVQDYSDQGNVEFLTKYLYQSATRGGYGNEYTEVKAYGLDDVLSKKLITDNSVLKILNDQNISDEERILSLRLEGLKLRTDVINEELKLIKAEIPQASEQVKKDLWRRTLELK